MELANGSLAVVVGMDEKSLKIDANNMLAGKQLTFELEVVSVEKGTGAAATEAAAAASSGSE